MAVTINGTTGISTPGLSSTADVTLAGSGVELLNNSGRIVVGQSGSVIQVVQTQLTSVQSFSTSPTYTWVSITGASASITPSSATSKILVQYSCMAQTATPAPYYATYLRMLRDGTAVAVGNASGFKAGAFAMSTSQQYGTCVAQVFLDSPATTSAVTYQLQVTGESTTTVVGGSYNSYPSGAAPQPNIPTSIILMEIAA